LVESIPLDSDKPKETVNPAGADIPQETVVAEKKFVSSGQKIHNELTYRVVDWLVNSAIGVGFAYWAQRTAQGKKWFGDPVTNAAKKVLSPILRSEASLNEGAKWSNMIASIMAGGTMIIPPMMVLENKTVKKKIIRWFDEKIHGKATVANDPRFDECYSKIDEEPKKGFWVGMLARFAALAPMIALVSIPATNKPMVKFIYDPIAKGSKWLAAKVGIKPGKMLTEGKLEHITGDPNLPKQFQSNWDFLHQTIGFDFGLTIFYSILHEMAYKKLAGFMSKKDREALDETEEYQLTPFSRFPDDEPAEPHRHAETRPKPRVAAPQGLYTQKIAEEAPQQGLAL